MLKQRTEAEDSDDQEGRGSAWERTAAVTVGLGLIGILILYFAHDRDSDRAAAAEFWGSLVSATMSTAAMFFFLAALAYQREDLRLQREELRAQRAELRAQREEMTKAREMNERHLELADLHLRQSMETMAEARFTALAKLRLELQQDGVVHGVVNAREHGERILRASDFCKSALTYSAHDPMLNSDRREAIENACEYL